MSRRVTSAIDELSVAEVRRGLDSVRTAWAKRGDDSFFMTTTAVNNMNIGEFTTKFVLGQHNKRHKKAKSSTTNNTNTTNRRVTRSQTQSSRAENHESL